MPGVRVSELITFQIEDIHRGHKDIYSKGNKMRRIYIPTILKGEFQQWFSAACRTVGPLFLNRFGSPISPSAVQLDMADFGRDPQLLGKLVKQTFMHHIHGYDPLFVLFPGKFRIFDRYLLQIISVFNLYTAQLIPSFISYCPYARS